MAPGCWSSTKQRIWRLCLVGCVTLAAGCVSSEGMVGGALTPAGGSSSPTVDESCTTPPNAEQMGMEVLARVNQIRRDNGLEEVTWSPTLAQIGGNYACRMIRGGFFAHIDPITGEGPGERAIKEGYLFLTLGENLGAGQPTPETVMEAWMASESHRENILNPVWKELGVGVRLGGEFGIYWTQEFGDPPASSSSTAGSDAEKSDS